MKVNEDILESLRSLIFNARSSINFGYIMLEIWSVW